MRGTVPTIERTHLKPENIRSIERKIARMRRMPTIETTQPRQRREAADVPQLATKKTPTEQRHTLPATQLKLEM